MLVNAQKLCLRVQVVREALFNLGITVKLFKMLDTLDMFRLVMNCVVMPIISLVGLMEM